MKQDPLQYFSPQQLMKIYHATTFETLYDIALAVIKKMPPQIGMVCGPMTTGGAGSMEKNIARFAHAVALLAARGENIFTQLPFEAPMQRIKEDASYYKGGDHLLEVFYLTLFTSGHIAYLAFLPDWESSYGARFEHEHARLLGIERRYIKNGFEMLPERASIYVGT